MDWLLPFVLCCLAGYVCGATPFGYFAGKLRGIDIREHGSGNIGATNVIRVMGKGIGIPVFILDVIKGWLPAWLAGNWFAGHGFSAELATAAAIGAGVAAVMGHNYTFWLKGKGGKGVATSCGALLATARVELAIAALVWIVTAKLTRYVSVASIAAALALPAAMAAFMASSGHWNFVLLGFGLALGSLAIWRHKGNIQRLLAGTENKMGAKKSVAP